jgi:hypothetical protein
MQIGLFYEVHRLLPRAGREPAGPHRRLVEDLAQASPAEAGELIHAHIWADKPASLRQGREQEVW